MTQLDGVRISKGACRVKKHLPTHWQETWSFGQRSRGPESYLEDEYKLRRSVNAEKDEKCTDGRFEKDEKEGDAKRSPIRRGPREKPVEGEEDPGPAPCCGFSSVLGCLRLGSRRMPQPAAEYSSAISVFFVPRKGARDRKLAYVSKSYDAALDRKSTRLNSSH